MIIRSVENLLDSRDSYELLPSNIGAEGGLSGFMSTYNALVLERNAYLRNATTKNPAVELITSQLNSLKENLIENEV